MPPTRHRAPVATIELHPDVLEAVGPEDDPETRFLGTLIVGGVAHHFDLIEVVDNGRFPQAAVHRDYGVLLEHHHTAAAADGPFATVELNGRQYALLVEPYVR